MHRTYPLNETHLLWGVRRRLAAGTGHICSLLLPPPTPTGPSSYFRPRHRGDAALLAGCHDDDNDEDEDDDDETNREGSGGERDDDAALEGDEKPDDVRQPASRATQVATIGYLMIILMSPL